MGFVLPGLMPFQDMVRDHELYNPKSGIFLKMGGGKAQPMTAPVLTPTGFTTMERVQVGTDVVVPDGTVAPIGGVYPQGLRPVHVLTLSDGREAEADEEHLWSVSSANDRHQGRPTRLMTTRQLIDDLRTTDGWSKWSIEASAPIDLGTWSSSIDPYVLGVLLGDGGMTQGVPTLSNPEQEIVQQVSASLAPMGIALVPMKTGIDYYLSSGGDNRHPNPLTEELRRLGLWGCGSGTKFVPDELLHSSIADRLALLRGLLDSDGTPHRAGFDFTIKSPRLAEAVVWLTRSLGGTASNRERVLRSGPYTGNVYRRVIGRLPGAVNPFLLERKAAKVRPLYDGSRSAPEKVFLAIRSIRFKGMEETQCIRVEHPLHEYVTSDFTRTHNTLATLSALALARPQGHILVVAPVNIARSVWIGEIEKWGFPLRTRSLIIDERDKKLTRAKRLERYAEVFADKPSMYFINNELITDLIKEMPVVKEQGRKVIQWPFPTVIIDESQSFKNPSSQRFKALAKVAPAMSRVHLLSGTPTPNGLEDIWAQAFLLDQGKALGPTMTGFHETFFRPVMFQNNRPIKWELLPGAEAEIHRRVGHLIMSAENADIPLPDFSNDVVHVTLPKDLMDAYKDFKKQLVLDLVDPAQPGVITITAENAAVLNNKLLQFASGTMYTGPNHDKDYVVLHDEKLQMADYLIRNAGGSPVIVAYRYRSDKQQLLKGLAKAGHHVEAFDGSRSMIDRWNSKSIPVMLLQPASAGHGLNLQAGGNTLIWYTLPDSLEHYSQANSRLIRIGQGEFVQIWRLIVRGTRDERMPELLERKDGVQTRLLDAVRISVMDDIEDVLGDLDISPL